MAEQTEDRQEEREEPQTQAAPAEGLAETPAEPTEPEGDGLPDNEVCLEEVGTWKKKVTITVPRERIDAKLNEMYGELMQKAQVPGFRIGRAPRRLVEKRFGKEVGEDVRNALVGKALGDAVEKNDLKTVGEPDLDLEAINLPEQGEMTFSLEVEVVPEFELPELKGIPVSRPQIEIDDARVDEYMEQLRQSRATYADTDQPVREGDLVTAGAKITGEQIEEVSRPGLELRAAPGQIEGIPLVDLGKQLAGKKAGETVTLTVSIPEAHPNESWQGKEASIQITISQVRRRSAPELDEEFATARGFDSLAEMRQGVADRLQSLVTAEVQGAMREQIRRYLLDRTEFDLPEGVVKRHTDRVLQRRTVDLLGRGVPRERIDENLTELQAAASEQARQELKLQFVLGRLCDDKEIETTEDEVNARVATMAASYNRRPERMRQELEQDGSLSALTMAIREDKALDLLLADAEISDVSPDEAPEEETDADPTGGDEKTEDQTEEDSQP